MNGNLSLPKNIQRSNITCCEEREVCTFFTVYLIRNKDSDTVLIAPVFVKSRLVQWAYLRRYLF